MNRDCPCETLSASGHGVILQGFSAVDRYLGLPPLPFTSLETGADLPVLARLFEGLRFPGVDLADGALDEGDRIWYFRCPGPEEGCAPQETAFRLLSLGQDWDSRRFRDPLGVYPLLRRIRERLRTFGPKAKGPAPETPKTFGPKANGLRPETPKTFGPKAKGPQAETPKDPMKGAEAGDLRWTVPAPGAEGYRATMEGALILARYGPEEGRRIREIAGDLRDLDRDTPPGPEAQRRLLTGILVSPRPDRGMELLKAAGFVKAFWPELSLLDEVGHSKDFHPEGNVWNHTMETFRYRKPRSGGWDLRLSLGLLLHDLGKPLSASSGGRPFDGHAELGARAARKFLERLEFAPSLIADIFYLVKNHMLPAALPRLPLARTGEIMASPLFPTLMELYRCDESSSFKGLDAYYRSSAAYREYRKKGKRGT